MHPLGPYTPSSANRSIPLKLWRYPQALAAIAPSAASATYCVVIALTSMEDGNQGETYIPPKDVGERLGVSPSGLRCLATLYEGLYGPLPRDPSDSRVWPLSAVERLATARALVNQGRAKSVQDALQATEEGSATEPLEALATRQPSGEAFAAMVGELRALRAEIAELRQEQSAITRQLAAPAESTEVNPQLQEILELNRARER